MIKIFIGLCAVLAVVMIVVGGMEYMTSELISSKESGKSKITHAIFGLLLALGAFAILNTINPNILNTELGSLKGVTVVVDVRSLDQPMVAVGGKYTYNNQTYVVGENWQAKAGDITDLSYSGATVYNAQCTTVGQQNCTSTRGLSPAVLDNIHDKCGTACPLVITGGTEFWLHNGGANTNHNISNSNVDLAVNPGLTQYVMGGSTVPAPYSWHEKNGVWYYYEVNHWHASVNKN